MHLSSHHRDTLEKIFRHPTSGNIEWREVLSLLDFVGTTTEERNGKFRVTLGPETEVLEAPRGKDIDEQMIVDLRRLLRRQASRRMIETQTPHEGCPDLFVLLVATTSSTRHYQDQLSGRLLKRLTTKCGLQSATTVTH